MTEGRDPFVDLKSVLGTESGFLGDDELGKWPQMLPWATLSPILSPTILIISYLLWSSLGLSVHS